MWEMGNFWTTERVNSAPVVSNPVPAMMHEIHVLLVDHDIESLINTAKQLEMWQYKVTYVEHATPAGTMLGKAKFDVVMANINFPDPHGFKVLQHAVNMCIPVVWMCDDENAVLAMRALESGAFLCIKKPLQVEFIRSMWQHVLREKARMIRERDMFVASNCNNLGQVRGIEFNQRGENPNPSPNPNPNPNAMMKNKAKHKQKRGARHDDWYEDDEYNSDYNIMSTHNGNVRRKMCTEWTQELHAKFMDAVTQLVEGRCFPKEILELMNEPGLTRMQVASHLQKCRNDNWRSPEERKPSHISNPQSAENCSRSLQPRPRIFGSMPRGNTRFIRPKTHETGQSSGTNWESTQPSNNEAGPKMGHARPAPDDYFMNFPDMDCLIHDFSARQPQPDTNDPTPPPDGYQLDPSINYSDDQNSGEASMQNKSN